MQMKLLCAADLHLGRQPTRIPEGLAQRAAELTPLAAWRSLVETAIELQVDAVLLAGDVLDDDYDFYESFGDLSSGVERLVEAGIEVVAVSGNHDVEVLPRLARVVPRLRLLGRGGTWESVTVEAAGRRVHVVGWSFPGRSVTASPLPSLDLASLDLAPAPVIGLLHCDLDQSASIHAPVAFHELESARLDAWLLGHVHKPSDLEARPVGYLGSISAADPGEEGRRGAWLLTVAASGIELEPIALSPLRWETVAVDISGMGEPAEVDARMISAIEELAQRIADGRGYLKAVGCRLHLTGRSRWRDEIVERVRRDDPRQVQVTAGSATFFVHDVKVLALPEVDLESVALGNDPVALMARKLLLVRSSGSEERGPLLEEARQRLVRAGSVNQYKQLAKAAVSDEAVAAYLEAAALRAIDVMEKRRSASEATQGEAERP